LQGSNQQRLRDEGRANTAAEKVGEEDTCDIWQTMRKRRRIHVIYDRANTAAEKVGEEDTCDIWQTMRKRRRIHVIYDRANTAAEKVGEGVEMGSRTALVL
jgi:hypothetical protein